jgi:ATP-dependent DNA helicase DinG
MDTGLHTAWAAGHMLALIEASGGSALVLSATAAAGRGYVDALRERFAGRLNVYSQWDGATASAVVGRWREDRTSVLVGTRSLMTGTDAPGQTCRLVVVDRIPRAAANPVDDARTEDLVERLSIDRWAADRLVYVSDAALLLEQAVGRLVRRIDDHGLVAVLDPRLLKVGPLSYPGPTRKAYLDALGAFGVRTPRLERATGYLSGLRQADAA